MTREKLRSMSGEGTVLPSSVAPAPSEPVSSSGVSAPSISRHLKSGSKGDDVTALQSFLGVEATGYFGPLTKSAVQAFQEKYGIASPGDPGFGEVGPLTRSILKGLSEAQP
jgi:peptidoglycan hydrolase-like protein with peptidoglycan-binding domain